MAGNVLVRATIQRESEQRPRLATPRKRQIATFATNRLGYYWWIVHTKAADAATRHI